MCPTRPIDRKSTRLNSSHTEIYTLSLHDALPIWAAGIIIADLNAAGAQAVAASVGGIGMACDVSNEADRSEERRVGKECRSLCDWSSDVCSSDLGGGHHHR